MLDIGNKPDDLSIKQVEINTIASSFGGLSPQVRALHSEVGVILVTERRSVTSCYHGSKISGSQQ